MESTKMINDTNNEFSSTIKQLMIRLDLSEKDASVYLGVPIHTLRKWIKGERIPGSATRRLLYVLGVVEAVAPWLHDVLVRPPNEDPTQ